MLAPGDQDLLLASHLRPMDDNLLQIAFDFSIPYEEVESIYDGCRDVEETRHLTSLIRSLLNSKAEYNKFL